MTTIMTPIASATTFLNATAPPTGISPPLLALWNAEHGGWDAAHALVQDAMGPEAAWVHAHLHRVEGDLGNAGYWYRRAGRAVARGDLAVEREAIAAFLLGAP